MDVIPGSGGIGKAPGVSDRSFPGTGAPMEASGASPPSDGGGTLRGQVRRQDSYGSVVSGGGGGGGGNGGWSGTGGSTAGAFSESKQDGGEVRSTLSYDSSSYRSGLLTVTGTFHVPCVN